MENGATKAGVIICLLLSYLPALAQTKGSDKEWKEAIEAAKREGKVVVAGSPDPVMRKEIIPKFTARFGIAVEFIAGRSSQIVSRVQTERSAGIYGVDVYLTGPDTTANELYGTKIIDPSKPLLVMPEVADGSKWKMGRVWFADPEERFVVRAFHQHRPRQAGGASFGHRPAQPQMAGKNFGRGSHGHGSRREFGGEVLSSTGGGFRQKSLYRSESDAHARPPPDVRLAGAWHPADLPQLPAGRRAPLDQGWL
jgi:hypothetical protein